MQGTTHEFSLVAESGQRLGPEAFVALRPYGCVALSGPRGERYEILFEAEAPDYLTAVQGAIDALEALSPSTRVTEITCNPVPMIRTTLSREDWDDVASPR
jgi:hypothetical protein